MPRSLQCFLTRQLIYRSRVTDATVWGSRTRRSTGRCHLACVRASTQPSPPAVLLPCRCALMLLRAPACRFRSGDRRKNISALSHRKINLFSRSTPVTYGLRPPASTLQMGSQRLTSPRQRYFVKTGLPQQRCNMGSPLCRKAPTKDMGIM